jgi:Fe2+ transport system protein FeoA
MGGQHDVSRTTSPGRHELAVVEDPDRGVHELHDQVVQRLFAMGFDLATIAEACPDASTRSRLVALGGDVDAAIRMIRQTAYELQRADGRP